MLYFACKNILPAENTDLTRKFWWKPKNIEFIAFPIEHRSEESKKNENAGIMKYFGAWKTDKSAEEIIADIYNSRTSEKTRILEDF